MCRVGRWHWLSFAFWSKLGSTVAVVHRDIELFVYGSLLPGEADHELLAAAEHLGSATTQPAFYLVELTGFPALVSGGTTSVSGEVYRIDVGTLRRIDVRKEHPILFQRESIELSDGRFVAAYLMSLSQVRGRRRLKVGDWRKRFSLPPSTTPESPWARWARSRSSKL